MTRMSSSAGKLPLYTLDLARQYWAPLLCVSIAGGFLHGMLLRGMVKLSEVHQILGMAGLSVSVMVSLATIIIMLHLLRPGLPTVDSDFTAGWARRRPTFSERERVFVNAVATAVLPFLIFYNLSKEFTEEFRLYSVALFNERGLEGFAEPTELKASGLVLVVALCSLALRALCEHHYRRTGNNVLGVLTALFEANWMFFALFSVQQLAGDAKAWVAERAVVDGLQQLLDGTVRSLGDLLSLPVEAGYAALLAAIAVMWGHLKEGLFEPFLWLTIAAVIYGARLDGHDSLFRRGSRAERIEKAVVQGRGFLRAPGRLLKGDMQDKYLPFLNAFRFVLRASPVFYLSFCLYYVLLELGAGWLQRGIFILVGPNEFLGWWWPWLIPIELVVDALKQLLLVCLLAATFETLLRRVGSAGTGRRARHAKETA